LSIKKIWAKIVISPLCDPVRKEEKPVPLRKFAFSQFFITCWHNNGGHFELPTIIQINYMRKILIACLATALFFAINACKKDSSNSNNKTVANLSGTYGISAITGNFGGISLNLYDSLPACEKDNTIQLNSNMTAVFVDAGTKCVPPSDSSGVWSLSSNSDTLYLAGTAAFIKSWDGSTLVLTNSQSENVGGIPVTLNITTTLSKK
jgi:hypothetical protein